MRKEQWVRANRLAVVGAATMFWMFVLQMFFSGFNLGHGLVLAMWIAMGSPYFARSFVDFQRPIRPLVFFAMMLMSPGWPITFYQARRSE